MHLQIPNLSLQQKQYRLQVSQFCFFKKSHLFFDFFFFFFCLRHTLPEQPCVPTPSPSRGLRAPWRTGRHTATQQPDAGGVLGLRHRTKTAQPLLPPCRGAPKLSKRYLCTGTKVSNPQFTKSPVSRSGSERQLKGVHALDLQSQPGAPSHCQGGLEAVRRVFSRSGAPLLLLSVQIPLHPTHQSHAWACAVFQLTMAGKERLTGSPESEKGKRGHTGHIFLSSLTLLQMELRG